MFKNHTIWLHCCHSILDMSPLFLLRIRTTQFSVFQVRDWKSISSHRNWKTNKNYQHEPVDTSTASLLALPIYTNTFKQRKKKSIRAIRQINKRRINAATIEMRLRVYSTQYTNRRIYDRIKAINNFFFVAVPSFVTLLATKSILCACKRHCRRCFLFMRVCARFRSLLYEMVMPVKLSHGSTYFNICFFLTFFGLDACFVIGQMHTAVRTIAYSPVYGSRVRSG